MAAILATIAGLAVSYTQQQQPQQLGPQIASNFLILRFYYIIRLFFILFFTKIINQQTSKKKKS